MAVYDRPLKTLIFDRTKRMALVIEAFKDTPGIRSLGYSGLDHGLRTRMKAKVIVRGLRVFSTSSSSPDGAGQPEDRSDIETVG